MVVATWLRPAPASPTAHRVLPMTNFVGLEEFSSISPDGHMVAFTATQGDRRQVFVRFLNGGPARPVTSDDADHQLPRWLPDGSSLVYFSPAAPGEVQGAIYRIPTLGGSAQRVIASIGGGDVSRSGRLACFRLENERIQLVTSALDGSDVRQVATLRDPALPVSAMVARQSVDCVSGGRRLSMGHLRRVCRRRHEAGQSHQRQQIHRGSDLASRQHRDRLSPRAAAAPFPTCLRWRCGRCRWTAGSRRGNSRRPRYRTSIPTSTRAASCPPLGCRCGSTSGNTRSTASRAAAFNAASRSRARPDRS